MKTRIFLLFGLTLLLGLAVGCQPATTQTIPQQSAAQSVGQLAYYSLQTTGNLSYIGVTGAGAKDVKITAVTEHPHTWEAGSWIHKIVEVSYPGSYTALYDMYFKIWATGDNLITDDTELSTLNEADVDKLHTYSIFDIDMTSPEAVSATVTLGNSKSDPLKMEGLTGASPIIDGPVSYSGTSQGTSYSVTLDYNNVSMSTGGYPTGTVHFSIVVGSSVAYAGTITFDGDNTATIHFTQGATGIYIVNLDTGIVTVASL